MTMAESGGGAPRRQDCSYHLPASYTAVDWWGEPARNVRSGQVGKKCLVVPTILGMAVLASVHLGRPAADELRRQHVAEGGFMAKPDEMVMTVTPPQDYQILSFGSCVAVGWVPILLKDICEDAAKDLHLASTRVRDNKLPNRPDGCYLLENRGDNTTTLWLSARPTNKGKGAETSEPEVGKSRRPICARQSLHISPAPQAAVVAAGGAKSSPSQASGGAAVALAPSPANVGKVGEDGDGVAWLGCYKAIFPLAEKSLMAKGLRADSVECAFKCQQFKYMALQDSGMCRCTDMAPYEADFKKVDDEKCGDLCKGEEGLEPRRFCGAKVHSAIFQLPKKQ